MKNSFKSNWRN